MELIVKDFHGILHKMGANVVPIPPVVAAVAAAATTTTSTTTTTAEWRANKQQERILIIK